MESYILSNKIEKVSFEINQVFCSSQNANLLAKSTVTFATGQVIEGMYPFQIPISSSERAFHEFVNEARERSIQHAEEILQDMLNRY